MHVIACGSELNLTGRMGLSEVRLRFARGRRGKFRGFVSGELEGEAGGGFGGVVGSDWWAGSDCS